MNRGQGAQDALDRWLNSDGMAVLDRIIGRSGDLIGAVDRDLRVRYVNWTVPGLTRETVIGKHVDDLTLPSYREQARDVFMRVLSTGVPEHFETLYRDDTNSTLIWLVRVGPIIDQGEVIGFVTISTDVTERRCAEIDRERSFSLSLDMLIVATQDGQLKRINPAVEEALGYSFAELKAMRLLDLVHPDDRERTRLISAQVRQGIPLRAFENRYRRRDGNYRVFSWRAIVDPITGDIYTVARDITEQRAAEAQLRHAQKMEAVGQLAGGIAHDFNNLMQAVLTNTHMALPNAPRDVADHLHEIAAAGRRAADLTKQLLLFSRRQALHRSVIDINELLRGLTTLLRRLIPENIHLQLDTADVLASVNADRTQLEQVIVNLCVNARDAMPQGGALIIKTENVVLDAQDCPPYSGVEAGNFIRISVIDSGEGIDASVRERIFDPFFTTKDQSRGTGLGLATVYGIVQQHGGVVRVDSALGHGATFQVDLPADDREAEDAPSRRSTIPPRLDTAPPQHSATILMAEDDPFVARPVIQLLERAGYRVLPARNDEEAVKLLREHGDNIDLALLDIVMPVLGGPEAYAQMHALRPSLRVLFMSGHADDHFRQLLPATARVLNKPFVPDTLLATIRATLTR